MLIVNNEILDKSAKQGKNASAAEFYRKSVKELREKYGDFITFYRPGVVKRNPSGALEPIPPMTVHLIGKHYGKDGIEQWIYAESMPPKRNGIFEPQKTSIFMREFLRLSLSHDIELAFFLAYIAGEVESGMVKIKDEASEARKEYMEKRSRIDVDYLLYHEDSPLADVKYLKEVASAFGLLGVKNLTGEQTRVLLDKHLFNLDSKKSAGSGLVGSKEFVDMVRNNPELVKRRAFLGYCRDNNILQYNPTSRTFSIPGMEIMIVPPIYGDEKNAFLYFLDHIFKAPFQKKWQDIVRAGIDDKYLSSLKKLDDMKWLFDEFDIKFTGKSIKQLKGEIMDHLAVVPS